MKHQYWLATATVLTAQLSSLTSLAWGPVGHEAIAHIAQDNLTAAARARVKEILGTNVDLASIANWADQVRDLSRPLTAPWHYIDIEVRGAVTENDEPRFCSHHNCVVDQIQTDITVLRTPSSTASEKLEALKFLVHFVGDLHQPLHCADDTDRGGNQKVVRFIEPGSQSTGGTPIKLHALWDGLIEIATAEKPRELATALEAKITTAQWQEWSTGTPADWAWEGFRIARDSIYKDLNAGPTEAGGVLLPASYYATNRTIVDTQLERAGLRLAHILNGLAPGQ